MNVVMIAINDPAGTAIAFCNALNRYTNVRARLITYEIRYNFMFQKDLHVPWLESFDEAEEVLKKADVIHFHMTANEYLRVGPLHLQDYIDGKLLVHHHHGEPLFRANPREFADREIAEGRPALVSTPDLHKMYPEATYLPNLVPQDDAPYLPVERGPRLGDYFIVSHSPTRKDLKNTDTFIEVCERLASRLKYFKYRVIEMTPHLECLRQKRHSSVFFDHMQGYYGVSSLEALAMGIPTIAGLDEWNQEEIRRFAGTDELPWVVARNPEMLEEALTMLYSDEKSWKKYSHLSRTFIENCWSDRKIAMRLANFYTVNLKNLSAARVARVA